ncbi:patatin-like phospholipase family protein [bacterium]|nr:patatin-like phospholipase family protein [bacterium]
MAPRTLHKRLTTLFIAFTALNLLLAPLPLLGEEPHRPKVGLVLAGGGALGFAHVGVLEVLEEHRIPIDLVTGTSMGAIVGAAYSAGVPLTEMKSLLASTDWDELFGEEVARRGVPFRYKGGRNREIYGSVKFGLDEEGELSLPLGVVEGQLVLPLLQRLYKTVPNPTDFDKLPLPFRAVTADIETGAAYVPERGDLAKVVRASMSVPGFFSPLEIDGKLLVDGGIANNTPVNIAQEMGADILIVVELFADLQTRQELNSPFAISGQIISLLLSQNSALQRSRMGGRDLLLAPDVKGFSATDFPKGEEILDRGRREALRMLPKLAALSVGEEQYQRYQEQRQSPQPSRPTSNLVARLIITNDSNIPDDQLEDMISLRPGEAFHLEAIEEGIQAIYETGLFQSVTYDAIDTPEGKEITVRARRKEYLDNYYRIGLALEDNFQGENNYRLGIFHRKNDIFEAGDHFEILGEIGRQPQFNTELYLPFSQESYFFIAPSLRTGQSNLSIRRGGERIARYHLLSGAAQIDLGRQIGNVGEARIGISRGFGDIERDIGDPQLPEFGFDSADVSSRVIFDALDEPDFPREGYLAGIGFTSSVEELGASDSFHSLSGATALPYTFGRNTLLFRGDFGITFDERPVERSYSLGGFLNVSGYEQNALFGSDFGIGRLLYYHNFSALQLPFLGFDFFAGGSAELLTLRSDSPATNDRSALWAGSAFLGADTPLFPIYLGIGFSEEDEVSAYFAIGRVGLGRN